MFNMHNKKTKQKMAGVLVAILVLSMVIPTLSYFFI